MSERAAATAAKGSPLLDGDVLGAHEAEPVAVLDRAVPGAPAHHGAVARNDPSTDRAR
jgi:hypothetical protein